MSPADLTAKVENQDKAKSLVQLAKELIETKQVNEKFYLKLVHYLSGIRAKLDIESARTTDNCAYYSEKDIGKIVEHLKKKGYTPPPELDINP